jgi:hypothetical protein
MADGSSAANASPVMIAGAYSVRPKLAAKAKAAFWLKPFATAVTITIASVNGKYTLTPTLKLPIVDSMSIVATAIYAISDILSRPVYEALPFRKLRIIVTMDMVMAKKTK